MEVPVIEIRSRWQYWNQVVRIGLTEQVRFKQRLERNVGNSHTGVKEKSIPDMKHSRNKGFKVGTHLAWQRSSKKVSLAGVECAERKAIDDKVREDTRAQMMQDLVGIVKSLVFTLSEISTLQWLLTEE